MNKAMVLKIRKEKKSKSDFDLTSKNQFMDVRVNFNTVETQRTQQAPNFVQKSPQKYASLSPDENNYMSKIKNNSSIKHMLAKIKAQQKRESQAAAEILRRELEEKMFQNRLKQFEIAEKRIKRKLRIQQKRVQSKELELTLNHSSSNNNNSNSQDKQKQRELVKSMSVNEFQDKQQKSGRVDQAAYSDRRLFLHSQRCSEQKIAKYSKLILPSQINQHKNSEKSMPTVIKSQANTQRNQNFHKLAIKKKRKPRIQIKSLVDQRVEEKLQKKSTQYASPRNKSTIEHQLQRIYQKPIKPSYKKAAELVDKMSARRRLKLKNNQQMDYVEANNKIKLLNFFYEIAN